MAGLTPLSPHFPRSFSYLVCFGLLRLRIPLVPPRQTTISSSQPPVHRVRTGGLAYADRQLGAVAALAHTGRLPWQSGGTGPARRPVDSGRHSADHQPVCLAALDETVLDCAAGDLCQCPVLHGVLRHFDGPGHDQQHPADRYARKLGPVQPQAAAGVAGHRSAACNLAVEDAHQERGQGLAKYSAYRAAVCSGCSAGRGIGSNLVQRPGPGGAQQYVAALHDQPGQPRAVCYGGVAGPHPQPAQAIRQHYRRSCAGQHLRQRPEATLAGAGGGRNRPRRELQPQWLCARHQPRACQARSAELAQRLLLRHQHA